MKILDKWKNRETKKKLREENIKLRAQLEMQAPIVTVNRNIQRVKGIYCTTDFCEERIPTQWRERVIKDEIKRNLMEYIEPFIQYDFKSNGDGGMDYIGTLYVATGDKNES